MMSSSTTMHRSSRRQSKQRCFFDPSFPNKLGLGLDQISEGKRADTDAANTAVIVYDDTLRPNGWRRFRPKLHNWGFIPPSIEEDARTVQKNGEAGFHFALGWVGLQEMIDKYGTDHAPTMDQTSSGNSNVNNEEETQEVAAEQTTDGGEMAQTSTAARRSARPSRISLSPAQERVTVNDDTETPTEEDEVVVPTNDTEAPTEEDEDWAPVIDEDEEDVVDENDDADTVAFETASSSEAEEEKQEVVIQNADMKSFATELSTLHRVRKRLYEDLESDVSTSNKRFKDEIKESLAKVKSRINTIEERY